MPHTPYYHSDERATAVLVDAALAQGSVRLAYQPVVMAYGGEVAPRPAFHEALIRIATEGGEIVPASAFIDRVEPLPTGRRLDVTALETALVALAAAPQLRLSVNMAPQTMRHAEWMRTLDEGLEADPTAAERLIVELTERAAAEDPGEVQRFLTQLRDRGISIALDDFGAGATSLSQFKALPVDVLKFHGDFFRGIEGDAGNRAIVRGVVSIARHFEMMTVAECIETPAEAECAAGLGVDCLQGWHIGRPSMVPLFHAGPPTVEPLMVTDV